MLNPDQPDRVLTTAAPPETPARAFYRLDLVTQILAVLALFAALKLGLLAALLAGLLVYQLVHILTPKDDVTLVQSHRGKVVVVTLLAVIVIGACAGAILGLVSLLGSGSESLGVLLRKMAEIVETARAHLPDWALSWLPADADELKKTASDGLREHASQLRSMGRDVSVALAHVLIGMIIGGLVAVSQETGHGEQGPLVQALSRRVSLLGSAFRSVVFAQIRISALNTVLTGFYLLAIVPMIETKLPLTKTMIAVTFIAGLLPVVGNLISNVVIVVVSLSVSPLLAASSLIFLIVIHKLEYFVNARLMGHQIQAKSWELLVALVVMDAAFGLPGVVAAPIYYAYLKKELAAEGLI